MTTQIEDIHSNLTHQINKLRSKILKIKFISEDTSTDFILKNIECLSKNFEVLRRELLKKIPNKNVSGYLSIKELCEKIYPTTGKRADLCAVCFFEIDGVVRLCPYCGSNLNIVFKDQCALECLNDYPTIGPITSKGLIPGPKSHKKKSRGKRGPYSTSLRKARLLIAWVRKKEYAFMFPFTVNQLDNLSPNDLRTIASLCDGYNFQLCCNFLKHEYIKFILANQPKKPIDIGPPPFGNLPKKI